MRDKEIALEIEVPGSPEEVWTAIATGPGISSWMHPTEVEERPGGKFFYEMVHGQNGSGTVAVWEPPHRFVQSSMWHPGSDLPPAPVATEWVVSARDGGTSVVRMVMSGFGDSSGWNEEIEGMSEGLAQALQLLRLYLTRFAGQPGAWTGAYGQGTGPVSDVWPAFSSSLGLESTVDGTSVVSPAGFSGVLDSVHRGRWRQEALLTLEHPAPGLATVFVIGEANWLGITARFFGSGATAVAAGAAAKWQSWLNEWQERQS